MKFYDSHNHLQDERLAPYLGQIIPEVTAGGVARMVVNGSCEADWEQVAQLAREHAFVVPSFGYHPWYIRERTADWEENLAQHLDSMPSAVGEIGLDRWIKDFDLEDQEKVFVRQLRMAAERNVPASIHCLQAWGKLEEVLRREPRPACGFILHSFGGPEEMIPPLTKLGGYFSLPGYFAHERKSRQRAAFKKVPIERLLIETDAPDQCLPEERTRFALPPTKEGKPVNHPANIAAVYSFAAELLEMDPTILANQVEENFLRLFRPVLARTPSNHCE